MTGKAVAPRIATSRHSRASLLTFESIVIPMSPNTPLDLGATRKIGDNDIIDDGVVGSLLPFLARCWNIIGVREEADALHDMPQLGIRVHGFDDSIDMPESQAALPLDVGIQNGHTTRDKG